MYKRQRWLKLGDGIFVSTKAPAGRDGVWLLDPEDLWIRDPSWSGYGYTTTGTTTITALAANSSAPILVSGVDTRDRGGGVSVLRTDTINAALGQGSVSIVATGSIDATGWEAGASYPNHYINYSGTNKLTFRAGTSITLYGSRFSLPSGTLELLAGTQINQSGTGIAGSIYANTLILGSSDGGTNKPSVNLTTSTNYINQVQASNLSSLSLANAQNLTVNSSGVSATGAVSLSATGNLSVNGSIATSGGDVLLKATGNLVQAASTSISTGGGDVTYWSNAGGTAGYIQLGTGVSVTTGGGDIVLGA